jgi:hypothetical protein
VSGSWFVVLEMVQVLCPTMIETRMRRGPTADQNRLVSRWSPGLGISHDPISQQNFRIQRGSVRRWLVRMLADRRNAVQPPANSARSIDISSSYGSCSTTSRWLPPGSCL